MASAAALPRPFALAGSISMRRCEQVSADGLAVVVSGPARARRACHVPSVPLRPERRRAADHLLLLLLRLLRPLRLLWLRLLCLMPATTAAQDALAGRECCHCG